MSQTNSEFSRKILAAASVVEIATGLALIVDPGIVARLLLGTELAGMAVVLGHCFGIALATLGWACWPGGRPAGSGSPAFRAMFAYNALIAAYLAYLGTAGHMSGLLLWPAVALHAAVALLLLRPAMR